MPAATAAFLRVDLKPGYRDQIAFDGLAKKFPGRGDVHHRPGDPDRAQMLDGTGLDYDTDVAPWFGQRAGIGAYADKSDHVIGLVALASTDDAKAKQALGKVSAAAHPGSFGFVVRDGYALLAIGGSDPQATAANAATAAATANLADDKNYRASVSHLPGQQPRGRLRGPGQGRPAGRQRPVWVYWPPAVLHGLGGADGMPGGGLGLLPGVAGAPTDALAKATGHIASESASSTTASRSTVTRTALHQPPPAAPTPKPRWTRCRTRPRRRSPSAASRPDSAGAEAAGLDARQARRRSRFGSGRTAAGDGGRDVTIW